MFFGGEPWLLQCANENVTVHQAFSTAAQKLTATTDIRVRTRPAHNVNVGETHPDASLTSGCGSLILPAHESCYACLLLPCARRADAGSKIERRGRVHPRGPLAVMFEICVRL